jgi:hypothetical protein
MSGSINNCSRSVLSILTKKDRPLISDALGSLTVKPWRISSTDFRTISLINESAKVSGATLDENWSRNAFKTVETSNGFESLDSLVRCAMDSQAGRNKAKDGLVNT